MATHLAQISALIGFLLPLLIQFVQKETWSNAIKSIVGIGACVIAAIISAAAQNKLNGHDLVTSVTTIFLMAKVSYLAIYKPAGLAQPKLKSKPAISP